MHMIPKFKFLLYCWGSILLFCPHPTIKASSGKYPIRIYSPAEYKAGIQNIDFAQNRDMTIYVANNLGVLSYNGSNWQTRDFRTGKKKRSLAFDKASNRLYVGAQGDFGYLEDDWRYVSLIDLLPAEAKDFDEVWDVFLLHSRVYFCTFQGIYVFDGKKIAVIEQEGGLDRSFAANGKLFTQSRKGELLEVKGTSLTQAFPQNVREEVIAGLIPEDDGYLIIYNSGQIEWTSPFATRPKYRSLSQRLQGTYVNHVLSLSDNRLAISTQTAGLFLFDPQDGSLEQISSREGLSSNACLRSFQDHFGNLWVGMQNGIAFIQINAPARFLGRESGIQGSGYDAFQTTEGTYFTTSNGIYFLPAGAVKSRFLSGTEGPAYGLQEIAGKLYAGSHSGLFLLENGRAERLAATNGLWKVKQLRQRPEYAIGGTYEGLYLFEIDEKQELQLLHKIQGFDASSRFFEEDQKGRIWVSQYYKGLYQLSLSADMRKAVVKNVSEASDLPIQEQVILSQISDGLFLATPSGLFQLDPAKDTIRRADLFSDQVGTREVYLLAQDQGNNVHIITEEAVAFFQRISTGNYLFVPSSLYQLRYHLNNDLLNASVNTRQGIFFSANEGFIQYEPEKEIPLKVEKPLLVNRVFSVTENKTIYARRPFEDSPASIPPLHIKSAAKVLKIDVESFQFNDLDGQEFRYSLKGLDPEFGEWTTSTTKEYTNLREGKYDFRFQTRNHLGQIIDGQALSLIVEPPFYRSTWAKAGYFVLAGGLILLFVWGQRSRFRKKARKLRAVQELELSREQQKRAEIKQKKEQELQRLREDKIQAEVQHLGRLLGASTMNLVVKNEFIESIKEELEELKKKGKRPEIKQTLEKIVKEIDVTLRVQEDWEQFEYHFDAVHGDFLTRLREDYPDLSPNEQKLCSFLRLNLNTKEIANLLGISIRGVEVARYRLRKKLALEKGENLSKFILEY